MSIIIRDRSQVDEKHTIRDPHGPGALDMAAFANTLMKTRIPELFLTVRGIPGHARQLQQELNRLASVEGRSSAEVDQAIRVSKCLREALKKAKAQVQQTTSQWDPVGISIHFQLLNDVVRI